MCRYFRLYDDGQREWVADHQGNMTYEPAKAALFTEATCPAWADDPDFELQREYLPEDQQNQRNGHPPLFIIRGGMMQPPETTLDEKIRQIQANIQAAEAKLAEVQNALDFLVSTGMYPAQAKEQWQTRPNSSGQYLYMIFRSDGDGGYLGPNGKRKVYVGADPNSIAEAKRLNQNIKTHETLKYRKYGLESWIHRQRRDVEAIERQIDQQLHASQNPPDIPELTFVANKLPGLEYAA